MRANQIRSGVDRRRLGGEGRDERKSGVSRPDGASKNVSNAIRPCGTVSSEVNLLGVSYATPCPEQKHDAASSSGACEGSHGAFSFSPGQQQRRVVLASSTPAAQRPHASGQPALIQKTRKSDTPLLIASQSIRPSYSLVNFIIGIKNRSPHGLRPKTPWDPEPRSGPLKSFLPSGSSPGCLAAVSRECSPRSCLRPWEALRKGDTER